MLTLNLKNNFSIFQLCFHSNVKGRCDFGWYSDVVQCSDYVRVCSKRKTNLVKLVVVHSNSNTNFRIFFV